jgi:uncharacterized protein YggE
MTPEAPASQNAPQRTTNALTLRLDLRWVVAALLLVIVVLLLLWRPWQAKLSPTGRTISVTGNSTVTTKPDQYVFSPEYQFKNTDKDAALKELTAKSDAVTTGLKKLGVPESKIKSSSNGYGDGNYYYYNATNNNYTYDLTFTITINDDKLLQKVQDYLVGSSPTGSVSTAKQKQLESQARDEATKEARAKANQSAKNLGFKVGPVKSVDDSGFDGGPIGIYNGLAAGAATSDSAKLQVQPGENNLNYSVTVVYYVR